MSMCEDFPACGHERGCCPDFDESGRQLNMVCTCGAKLPVDNRFSICDTCLNESQLDGWDRNDYDDEYDPGELKENEDFAHDDDFYNRVEDMGDFWGDD
jgi:hypothetical protein